MTEREALKLALEALKQIDEAMPFPVAKLAIMEAEKALAQPEQEPVALPCCGYTDASAIKWNPYNQVVQCHNCGQVYTTSPQRTEQEQQIETLKRCLFQMQEAAKDLVEQAKSLTPPQRTWVGLTTQERDEINEQVYGAVPHHVAFHAAIEAKLKEKNA